MRLGASHAKSSAQEGLEVGVNIKGNKCLTQASFLEKVVMMRVERQS
jgi:hypothetical protein